MRGRRLLAQADVVVADRLGPAVLLDELPPDVEVIDAAKMPRGRSMAQEADQRAAGRPRAGRASGWSGSRAATRSSSAAAWRRSRRCAAAGVPVDGRPRHHQRDRRARAGRHPGHPPRAWPTSSPSSPATCRPGDRSRWSTGPPSRRLRGTLVVLMGVETAPAIAAALVAHGRAPRHAGRHRQRGLDPDAAHRADAPSPGCPPPWPPPTSGRRRCGWSATSSRWHRGSGRTPRRRPTLLAEPAGPTGVSGRRSRTPPCSPCWYRRPARIHPRRSRARRRPPRGGR